MRNKAEFRKSQSGQILLYTTIILVLAALILVPLMQFAFTSHRSAQIRQERTLELYASDAGIEDALYQIKTEKKGTALANLGFGNTSAYNPGTPGMNDRTMGVNVQKVWLPQDLTGNNPQGNPWKTGAPVDSTTPSLDTDKSDDLVVVGMLKTIQAEAASDYFDSGWPGSGSGNWAGSWVPTGSVTVNSTEGCNGNSLKLADVPSTATRTVNLLKYMKPQLKFTAKASSLEGNDTVYLKVKYGDSDWETPVTWGDGNESSGCNAFNIDLYDLYGWAGNNTSVPLQIKFDGNLSSYLIASHDLEPPNNTWTGGSVWVSQWTTSSGSGNPTGETAILSGNDGNGLPTQGSYYLRLRSSTGYAQRKLNLSGYTNPHLQFWAKATSFESSENAQFLTRVGNSGSFSSRLTWRDGGTYPSWPAERKDDNVYHYFDVDLSQLGGSEESNYWIAFDANMGSTTDYFYVDDIRVVEGDSFYIDNLWIGDEYYSNTIEIVYTDPNFDPTIGSPGVNDPAFLDRVGIWMPPGCHYVAVVGNETSVELRQEPMNILLDTYAGGTIVEWDFTSPGVALHQPSGQLPIVKTLTFTYAVDVAQTVEGMFTWLEAHEGPSKVKTYLSWDKGYEIYKAVSQAHSEIYGTNTQVTAYVSQGEVNKTNAASYGDYVATGNALLIDDEGSSQVKEKVINPSDPYTWVTKDGFLYDGRSDITSIPSDAEVVAGWLYWSAFMNNTDWASFGSQPDEDVSFMYPMRWPTETFPVYAGNVTSRTYVVKAYAASAQEPMDLLAHEPVLTLSQMRYLGEVLGTATLGNSTPDSWLTLHKPIVSSPAPTVWVGGVLKSQSGNYTINYDTGNVTIINPNLSGQVTIDYSVSGTMKLTKGTDYTISSDTLGQDTKYKGFAITNADITLNKLQGTVIIDYYYAKHWQTVHHAAYNKYGTLLAPAQTEVTTPSDGHVGHSYACFDDVTELLTNNGADDFIGKGQYAVGDVKSTQGEDGSYWATRSFSGWSLIVLYRSPTETAHQFYLYDPIHNAADCPFQVRPVTDYSPNPEYINVPFTLKDFYPPEGTVEGRTTYFVGEGDVGFTNDYVGFKGASQSSYTYLSDGIINPQNNVMNCKSTTGEMGIDIDTYPILDEVGSDTEANVNLRTKGDRWYLVYMILSFRTNEVPKQEYAFNVASVTYQYELGK